MINVVIVDDHPIVREGLKAIISATPGMVVSGEARDGCEALRILKTTPCDVVLLDISMPGLNGLSVLERLHAESPHVPVLVLTVHEEDQYAVRSLRAGASGYLTKTSGAAMLVQAIYKVCEGGKYISEHIAEKLIPTTGRPQTLSRREREVLCMIASGKQVSLIAEDLGLSVKTISTYRTRVLEKLQLRNNGEITHYAIKEGLVD
jgi:two-component system invasion response regulator UvrY